MTKIEYREYLVGKPPREFAAVTAIYSTQEFFSRAFEEFPF
jgi:hypothetical protein